MVSSLFGLAGEAVYILRPSVSYDDAMDEVEELAAERVENVLLGQPTAEDISNAERLHGVAAKYSVCLPKGYTEPLDGCYVVREADVDGDPLEAQPRWKVAADTPPLPERLTPTQWNRTVIAGVENG